MEETNPFCWMTRSSDSTIPPVVQFSRGPVKYETPLLKTSMSISPSRFLVIAREKRVADIRNRVFGRVDLYNRYHRHTPLVNDQGVSYLSMASSIPSLFLSNSVLNHALKATPSSRVRSSCWRTGATDFKYRPDNVASPTVKASAASYMKPDRWDRGIAGLKSRLTLYRYKMVCKKRTISPKWVNAVWGSPYGGDESKRMHRWSYHLPTVSQSYSSMNQRPWKMTSESFICKARMSCAASWEYRILQTWLKDSASNERASTVKR